MLEFTAPPGLSTRSKCDRARSDPAEVTLRLKVIDNDKEAKTQTVRCGAEVFWVTSR
jgi:hypothetical protein